MMATLTRLRHISIKDPNLAEKLESEGWNVFVRVGADGAPFFVALFDEALRNEPKSTPSLATLQCPNCQSTQILMVEEGDEITCPCCLEAFDLDEWE